MKRQNRSATIFNNVMGPIGVGPSTSNTCGPCRVAYLSGKLCEGTLKKARIVFPADGGYSSPNGKGMRSDYAFAHGLLGRLPDSPAPLLEAFHELERQNVEIEFVVDETLPSGGAHLMSVLELTDVNEVCTKVCGLSKGGGIIELIGIDDFQVSIGGEYNMLLVFARGNSTEAAGLVEELTQKYPELAAYEYEISEAADRTLFLFPTYELFEDEKLQEIKRMAAVERACVLPAILPVVVKPQPQLPFSDAAELEAYCGRGATLTEAAVAYEKAVSGWDEKRIHEFAFSAVKAMRNAVSCGLQPGLTFDGIVNPFASKMMERQEERAFNDGIVTKAAIYSLAIMEYSNASGVIVCMPTAGAAGVVAGALLAAAEQLKSSDDAVVKAILAAGAVGISISEDNDFCGGVYGCQAEVGCASCMAAAGLVTLAGGTAQQAMNAASMALQNMLGLICDPVCGLVQVPCFSRNMSAAANAIVCSNASMLGFDGVIPLQDAFEAMKSSGSQLPAVLKGCGGGLCATARGKQLLKEYGESEKI